jgi:UPF0755 protein
MSEEKKRHSRFRTRVALVCGGLAVIAILTALGYAALFGPTDRYASPAQFLVSPDEPITQIANDLAGQGYVRAAFIFELAWVREGDDLKIRPGEYDLSKSMDAWTIASALTLRPAVAWVTIPVGLRKEQIEDILADALGWGGHERALWENATASTSPNYLEGVYFPDTYLIPTNQAPDEIAQRMRDDFKKQFAPYADEALKQHIPWTTVLTIASLIQREAGGASDMPIISGIIQKRLASGMPLAIDATLQYMSGTEGNWWPHLASAATYPDSPFNTYKHTGLPPHPIANPGLVAINAALHPATTNCLFYLHDPKGQIHCSPTYKGQLVNIQKYLK